MRSFNVLDVKSFRRVLNVVYIFLGNSLASEFRWWGITQKKVYNSCNVNWCTAMRRDQGAFAVTPLLLLPPEISPVLNTQEGGVSVWVLTSSNIECL
jgi:hypothetical protein